MMKRFQRKRRGGGDGRRSAIDASSWLPRIVDQGLVGASALEAWPESGVPDRVAAIGRGERTDGSPVLVAFSPHSATEALLGGLAAVHTAASESPFTGELLVVAPQWPAGARRVLGLLGRTPYSLEPIAAPGLSEGRVVVEPEPMPKILAANAAQLAARMTSTEARSAFARATAALEGLAAKHGGCVRVGADRVELVVLARRVAEIRADGDNAVLEVQVGGRSSTPLSGTDLAGALDGLEGQLRRRLNDRKVREGEEGLRGRVIGQLAEGSELRSLRPWPQPGTDQDAVDGVGVNAEGEPVVVAVREGFDWTALAAVLESLAPLEALMPVLFADAAPPLRLGTPRLLLAAERFEGGLESALASLVVAYELRDVSGERGASLDLVARSTGEGAERRPSRRGRRRGGRGHSSDGATESAPADAEGSGTTDEATPADGPKARAGGGSDERGDGDESGRGRGRRRRRSRRGRSEGAEGGETEVPAREGREGREAEEGGSGNGARRKRRFEEVSLLDLDEGPDADVEPAKADSARDEEAGDGSRRRRGRRRGRRGGGEPRKGDVPEGPASDADDPDEASESLTEDDLVDADDLSEILARLPDDVPDFEGTGASEPSYDDDEEVEDEGDETPRGRRPRRGRDDAGEDENRPAPRKRSAILVHADVDSLFAATLLARDIRQLEGMWVYPQSELMTFFRSIATDLRDDTPIFLIGFTPSPAHDVVQAANLYRGRIIWFDRHAWPPEDLAAMRDSIGAEAVIGGTGVDSSLPLVLETCTRRSRFSDKLVDLATGRFTEHDFERWGRLWRHRAAEIVQKSGDIRGDIAALLAGRPSDLAKEAALVEIPPPPPEVAWVAERDFRLVHFGGHVLVVFEVDPEMDIHLSARIARERYGATLSLVRVAGEESFVFAGDETTGKRALDYMAIAEHLGDKLEWVEARPDADHVSRFAVRDVDRRPERLEEVIGEIAMGRSLLER